MRQTAKKIMPEGRLGRFVVGILLVIGGILGFLPVLGFWMIPLGFIILSVDFPFIRKQRRKAEVKLGRWWQDRKKRQAQKRSKTQ